MPVNKRTSPYFDDYNASDNYHEILFRPRFAVQTRELNQIQTMFHEQLRRFGDHTFEDGSMVIPGESSFDLDLDYVTATITDYESVASQIIPGSTMVRGLSGITANVKLVKSPEDNDPLTFYLEYLDASDSGEQSKFGDGESIELIDQNDNVFATGTADSTGVASKFTINNGVYYLSGRFVMVTEQTIILDKYGNTPSKVVCLDYEESVVTENQDTALFDNAQGTPNFTAPGAHRLRVDTNLVAYDLDQLETLPENSIEIFRIEEGRVQKNVRQPQYAVLNDVMAQRTYEESGDYTVDPFKIGFREYDERYTETPDETKFVTNLESGLAYVRGYRVETLDTESVVVDKARSTGTINNSSISASLGYYIEVSGLHILPNISTLQEITFYDAAVSTPGVQPSGNALGTARVRFVREDGGNHRLYLFNVRDASGARKTGFISNALSIYSSVGEPTSADLVSSELFEPLNNSLVFPMNVEFVRSLVDSQGVTDTSYGSVRQYTTTTDSNGKVTFSALSNEVFVSQDDTYALASFTDDGEFISVVGNYTLSGTPLGSVITFDFGLANADRPIRINVQLAKQQVVQKTKTLETSSVIDSLDGNGRIYLNKADATAITSVVDDQGTDVTGSFSLHVNKTLSYYDVSYVTGPSTGVTYPVTVSFEYFSHSSGDYFGPDSYVDVEYKDIPSENGVRLSDVLDFRPRISDSGDGFSGAGSVVGNIPTPFTIVSTDIEHYLSRKDKVYVDIDGNFGVVQGVPSLNPKMPNDPSNSMVLYTLNVPAYTFAVSDINADKVNNRRYTMKDIGALESRISNVEYYVSLNMLEQEAESKQVIDPETGLNRFKNGFLTDSFADHSVGDFTWSGYHVAVSPDEGNLRPEFSMNAIDLEMNEADSLNVVNNGGIVTLPYTHQTFIRQNTRSSTMNVNPYAVFRWSGDIELSPSVDSWIDTVYTNPEVTYNVFNNGELTQSWKSWQLNWSGGTTTSSSIVDSFRERRGGFNHRARRSDDILIGDGNVSHDVGWLRDINVISNQTTRTNVDIVGDRVVDTAVIPYMRSINIDISGVGNRPRARMYFFFDGVNVDQYVKPSGGSYGQAVKADVDGDFEAVFRIPNNDNDKFRTGDKKLVVTDHPENVRELSTSYGETMFSSTGVRRTRTQTIVATRRITRTTTNRVRRDWFDPLAQSFLVERDGGIFVTKIDVFFKTKDTRVPITVEIREMQNGAPTQNIIPDAKKTLVPSQVNTSDDGSLATTFEFPHPIYLTDGSEYCFVIWSNSNNYNAFIARMGEQDMGTGRYIVEQPYAGVLFKSQNNSTWTADQTADLQFEIHSAEFDVNTTGQLIVNNTDFDAIRLPANSVDTVDGSADLVINRERHNYAVGSFVEITGAIGGNGIGDADINDIHEVTEVVSPNQFKINTGTLATASGSIGGDVMDISHTVQASLLNPNIPVLEPSRTSIIMEAKGTTGKSIDGVEIPYQPINGYIEVSNEDINDLDFPWLITNRMDEQQNLSGARSFTMRMTMSTNNSNLSPVVDMQGNTVITPCSLVTKPDTVEADGSNNWANYRTKLTGVKNPANSIRVFIDADKPQGSSIVVSARFGNSDEEIIDSEWTELNTVVTQTSGDGEGFLENEYALENVSEYTLYQVMVQLQSDSSVSHPICSRLRVLALGT